jgi:hypothetical protein
MIYLIFNIFIYSGGRKGPPLLEVRVGGVSLETRGGVVGVLRVWVETEWCVVVDVHALGCAKVPKCHNEKGRTLLVALKPKK